jgi:response regulator RpfG family c-di-GMP phosphodiesterase
MTDELNAKLDMLHARMSTMELTLAKVSDALVSIARIEERMQANSEALSRAFEANHKLAEALSKHEHLADERMRKLEEVAPVHKLVSGWVLAWIAGAVGLLGGVVASKVLGGN